MTDAREERRLVTCVFIDIVGSTDLTVRLGPERLKGALNAAFAEVSARIVAEGGIVEKFIGDAVYALFGAPIAHADDPLRALRAAHACRLWAARPDAPFGLRIGIETGDAVVDLLAVETTHQRMSVGAVVNAAARLEQAAEPGQVLVGPTCHEAAEGARFRPRGEMVFKGLPPMIVWELEDPGLAPASIDLPFVGRRSELEILQLAHGRNHKRAVLALVSGPPGRERPARSGSSSSGSDGRSSSPAFVRSARSARARPGATFWVDKVLTATPSPRSWPRSMTLLTVTGSCVACCTARASR